ncbi:M20/M25/M40 family metallo-hydrolase [Saccharothrix sp. S26]|uniref:M20/M25/M40 family metallo-hydrolase n=1 Tax=Saccharothrix sp. S26 TaxID=2907215 RepID=UPI001F34F20A|nr:M20/M25/M40 family metallo-hydrolase [Saccharothrix sp. S26]MCE7000453.1 M20/M25/M40 family metallo-hydrolase [Saccharothrix sp. S26]
MIPRVVVLLVLAAVGALAVLAFRPPAPVADAPPAEFAAGRAERHLEAVAQRPHPIGSADGERVRDYVADTARRLGAEVTVESDEVVVPWRGVARVATAHNVVARVRGTDPSVSAGKALLLVAHHDSVPTGPGAADDGAAVAAMLETLRALTTGGVRNDVVFLFTDGEEAGSLGARAYVRRHGVDGVGAVLNWEARGSGGPVWMFQTGPGNGPLVSAFGGASSRPIANSFAYEVYRRMPNYSDFTVFQEAGARGLDSAFIEHVRDYHSPHDDVERLDRGSLQHHGETMVGLVRALGDRDLRAGGGDAVYFDLFSRVLVRYPTWFAVALAAVTVVALASLLVLGVRSGRLRWRAVLAVAGVAVGAVVVAGAVSFGAWLLVAAARPGLGFLALSEPPERGWFVAGSCLLGLAALVAAARVARRWSTAEVVAGALVVTAVLLVASAVAVPGASFLFQWTLLTGLPALATPRAASLPPLVAAAIFPPLVGTMMVALGMPLSAVAVVFGALAGVLLLPLLPSGSWWPAVGVTAVAVALLATGTARFGFTPDQPRPDSLIYLRDTATGRSSWLSPDPAPDAWTSRVLGANPERLASAHPVSTGPVMRADAPDLDLPTPTATALTSPIPPSPDLTSPDGPARTVTFRITPTARAWRTHVTLSERGLRGCRIGPTDLPSTTLELYGPSSRDLTCHLAPGTPLEVTVADQWVGLPAEAAALVGPRPPDTMPVQSGNRPFDGAVVRATFQL